MTQCHNCPKPSIIFVGDGKIPLCLDCWAKLEQTLDLEVAQHERHLNYLADEIDMSMGMPRSGPRYPERKPPVIVQGTTLNNINVANSNVGMINTGDLHQVDSAITVIAKHGDPEVAQALRSLVEYVASSPAISDPDKKEAVEILSVVGSEAVKLADSNVKAWFGCS